MTPKLSKNQILVLTKTDKIIKIPKHLGPKIFLTPKNYGPQKSLSQKHYGPKKLSDPRKSFAHKNLGP